MMQTGDPALAEPFTRQKDPTKAQEMYSYVQKGTPVICYHLAGTERPSEQEKGAPTEGSEAADTSAETDTVQ